jgi:hypothetical protein
MAKELDAPNNVAAAIHLDFMQSTLTKPTRVCVSDV